MGNRRSERNNLEGAEWYAIYIRHQHEKAVTDSLSRLGVEVFLPTFPCYVFLRSCFEQRWKILATSGVRSFVMFGGRPALISDREIDAIRKAVESNLRVKPHPFLRCGDWARVKSGPLANIEGILVRKKGSYRLVLSLELLGKSKSVEVGASSVQPLSRRASPTLVPQKGS